MASEIVTTYPEMYDAPPLQGNYTTDAHMHLWCSQALGAVVGSKDAMEVWNDDIQEALRYLLACEIKRAAQAHAAESHKAAR